jgi:uncharacterized membrane protein
MTTEIEDYLNSLRAELGPMTIAEREEIIREIGAHIRDSVEESGTPAAAVLERLGPSVELAAQYRDGFLIRQASRSVSPLVLLRATLRLATKGLSGVLVFFFGLIGYLTGGSLVLSALLKPFFPANTGLWIFKYGHSVSSGVLSSPPAPPAHEVLGMWYIVVALTAGCLLLLLTTFAIRKCLRLSQRWQSKL